MYSKPLYNLFLIFFLAAVPFIYFDRAFMILCAHRAQLCGKIRLFCYISLFLRNYLFRMRLFVAGPGGWVGALWEGWQVCGARFPFFAARWVHRAPANGLRCLRRRVCVWWIARPPTGRRSPFTTGCGVAADMPFAFCPPCRSLSAPAPEVHLRATKIADLSQAQNPAAFAETDELFDVSDSSQLPAFNLSCVNCNPSRAILCGTYLII